MLSMSHEKKASYPYRFSHMQVPNARFTQPMGLLLAIICLYQFLLVECGTLPGSEVSAHGGGNKSMTARRMETLK